MTAETINTYLQAYGMVCVLLVPYCIVKMYLMNKDYDKLEIKYIAVLDRVDVLHKELNKRAGLISRFQSKRDKHKQEAASWAKQKYNLKQKIKVLEEM